MIGSLTCLSLAVLALSLLLAFVLVSARRERAELLDRLMCRDFAEYRANGEQIRNSLRETKNQRIRKAWRDPRGKEDE